MTIIQKHGKGKPTSLAKYQFGWSEGNGDYLGELYINDGEKGIHPVTDQVKNEIMNEVHNIEGNILSKIRNGKLKAFNTFANLVEFIEADNSLSADKRKLEVNDQFIVKSDESPAGHKDTVLWVIFDKDAGKDYDPENTINVGENLIAEPVTHLDFTYHDPKSVDGVNRSDYDTENEYIEASKDTFGIAVGEVDEDGNTIDISLTEKTTDFLNALDNLGLVGNGGNDIFREGFVNGLSVEDNPIVDVSKGDGTVHSGVKISVSKMAKVDGEWKQVKDDTTALVLNLDDLVIDEGSWA